MMICLCVDVEKMKGRAMSAWSVGNISTIIAHSLLELGLLRMYVSWLKGRDINDETNLVQHKNQLFTLDLSAPHLFLYQPTSTTLRIASIKHKNNDITLVYYFVQSSKIVLSHLLPRSARLCRR